ncbi:SPOC domain-like protein [Nadsonia fulvescens var. elongata DSM 6958]|uniref:ATP-dependent DNA helicase II subunit 2 n=1 Tax=Nadsonia fulvescens var. elongata DSM 6958 TaxID=857566 RepID=A0A1E3PQT8_9ASCO|nr:SPOC domain-like protein [Nadsonia fulvescens var. elongata DSM 6958]
MGQYCQGLPHVTQLEAVTSYMYDTIASKVLSQRKTDQVGVIKVRFEKWEEGAKDFIYDRNAENDCKYIQQVCPIKQFSLKNLRELKDQIKPSLENDSGDLGAAIKLGIEVIYDHCKRLKYKKKIILLTNASGELSEESTTQIRKDFKSENIEFVTIVAGCLNSGMATNERISHNIQRLKFLCDTVHGIYAEAPEAALSLEMPKIKPVKPVRGCTIPLCFGDVNESPNEFSISVDTYPCTRKAAVPSATAYSNIITSQNSQMGQNTGIDMPDCSYYGAEKTAEFKEANLEQLSYLREYYIKRDDDSKQVIAEDDRVSAYRYGQELVPISKMEDELFKFPTAASLLMIGFIPIESIKRWFLMGPTDFVVPTIGTRTNKAPNKEYNSIVMSSLSRAMIEMDLAMIGRFVKKSGNEPEMVLLMPKVEPDIEGLVMCRVPFYEDVRYFEFPPLTTNIGVISKKPQADVRYLPNEEIISAMDEFIDSMDLDHPELIPFGAPQNSTCDLNNSDANADDGECSVDVVDSDFIKRELLFNPLLHRINSIIKACAIQGSTDDSTIPKDVPILSEFTHPHKILVVNSEAKLNKLKHLLDIKEVSEDAKAGKRLRGNGISAYDTRGQEGLDAEAILNRF